MLATSHTNLYTANHNNHWATPNCLSGDHLMKTQPIKQNVMAHVIIREQSTGLFPCTRGRKAGKHNIYIQGAWGMQRYIAVLAEHCLSSVWLLTQSMHDQPHCEKGFCNSQGHVHFLWRGISDAFCTLTFWSSLPCMQQWNAHLKKTKASNQQSQHSCMKAFITC